VQRVAERFLGGHRLLLKRLSGLVARVAQRLELLKLRVRESEEVLQHGDGIRPGPSRSAGARRGTSGGAAHVRLRGQRKGDEECESEKRKGFLHGSFLFVFQFRGWGGGGCGP